MSPTARTLRMLRRAGYAAAVVERFIPQTQRKADLFGVGDVLAVHPAEPTVLLIQATTAGHLGDRLARCRARPELAAWLASGQRFEVWGWHRADGRWAVRRVAVQRGDLAVDLTPRTRARRQRKGERQRSLFDEPPPGGQA